jgi:AcrR family transcriptional regulator
MSGPSARRQRAGAAQPRKPRSTGGEGVPATEGADPGRALPVGTRERVLEVTLDLVRNRGSAAISLVEAAALAGVSRQTLYILFGSRAGLLMALVDHLDRTHAGPARLAALRQRSNADLEPYVRAWFDYLPEVLSVGRALAAAAIAGDKDARAALHSRMQKLHGGFTLMVKGLQAAGRLRPGWTVRTAADWILALTGFGLWEQLVVDAGWKPADHIERIIATLRQTLIAD